MLPSTAPEEYANRELLWNDVQRQEKRSDAQLAREVEVALPVELTREQQIEVLHSFIRKNFVDEGMIADFAIHDKEDGNPHAHIMLTTRGFTADRKWGKKQKSVFANARDEKGRAVYDPSLPSYDPRDKEHTAQYRIPVLDADGNQKTRIRKGKGAEYLWEKITIPVNDWNDQNKAEQWRASWAEECNRFLEPEQQIDHRSYAEKDHEAIIEPEVFDHVQDEMARREHENRSGGQNIFSMKIKCGDCGAWYGPKVWHSNDPYRKVIWQCNSKFSDKEHRCQTPHLSEEEIKTAFMKAMAKILTEKDELKENLQVLLRDSTDTEKLKEKKRKAESEMKVYADALNEETDRNAEVAQNQDKYRKREGELMDRYNAAKDALEQAEEGILMAGIHRKDIRRFIEALNTTGPDTKFPESEWSGLVDCMTVFRDGRIEVKFRAGMKVEV